MKGDVAMRSGSRAALLLLLLALSACGDRDAKPAGAGPESASAAAPAISPAPTGVRPGEFVLSVVGGRVQLASREAARGPMLRRLADLEGFELQAGALPRRSLTLQLDEVSLATAVDALLDDLSYRARFEHDEELGRNRLVSLEVGDLEELAKLAAPKPEGPRPAPGGRKDEPGEDLEPSRKLGRAERNRDYAEETRRWLEGLDSPDDRERLEAAEEVDLEGPGLDRLIELARDDADPRVRAAAVERLEDSGTFAATQALLQALGDGDSRVVLRAIEGLEFVGDESIIPHLEPLRDHDDPEVRDAAIEAIEFLE